MNRSHGEELWQLHTGLEMKGLCQLIDLKTIPQPMREIERKYIFSATDGNVDYQLSCLFARIGAHIEKRKLDVQMYTFVGIDQYYIFKRDGREFQFRYRSGANRPPQLTVKFKLGLSITIRGEVNLGVERTDPSKVRAFMSVIAAIAGKPIMFTIQQSGNIWTIGSRASEQKVEIVGYRVHRFLPSVIDGAFAEIEPLEAPTAEAALDEISSVEKALALKPFECKQSIAELFRPGNEKVLKRLACPKNR